MYVQVSSRNLQPVEISAAAAEEQTAGLETVGPEQVPAVASGAVDTANLHISAAKRLFEKNSSEPVKVAQSWKVSEEEFIVKVDASPLHQSAARRMFDKKPAAAAQQMETTVEETTEEATAEAEEPEAPVTEQVKKEWGDFWGKMMKLYSSGSK